MGSRPGRTPDKAILDRVGEALEKVPAFPNALATTIPANEVVSRGGEFENSRIALIPGMEDAICELKYAGASTRKIAARVGLSHEIIRRYLRSDRFAHAFDARKDALDARVSEFIRARVQENVLRTLDDLIHMRDKATGWLRRQLNMDILLLNEKYAGGGTAVGAAGQLRAVHERLVRRGKGNVEKVTTTITGDREAVGAAIAEARRAAARRTRTDDAGGAGEEDRGLHEAPSADRGDGAGEAAGGAAGGGGDGGGLSGDGKPSGAADGSPERPSGAGGD